MKKIHLEYLLNATSKNILWEAISTPTGLEGWFADKVLADGKKVTFCWGKTEQRRAEVIGMRAYSFIRFRWEDSDSEHDYFELKMTNSELTNDFVLEINDSVPEEEEQDARELWESQVETLRRTCGF